MTQPTNHWKLGLFVTLGLVAAIALLAWVGSTRLEREAEISYYFFDEQVDGLEVGSPIKFRGVPIGKVVGIRIAADQRHVEVKGEVFTDALERIGLEREIESPDEGPYVSADLRVQVVTNFLTGVSFLQGDFFDPESHPVPDYPFRIPWNTVHTAPSATTSVSEAIEEISNLLPPLLREAQDTLEVMRTAVEDIGPKDLSLRFQGLSLALEDSLLELDTGSLMEHADETLGGIDDTVSEVGQLVQELRAEARVGDTTASLRELSSRLTSTADEFAALGRVALGELEGLDETLTALRRLAELLERDPGSLLRGRSPRNIPGLEGR